MHSQRAARSAPAVDPVFDTDRRLVRYGEGRSRAVQPQTWQAIMFLVGRLGKLVRRDVLYDELWPQHCSETPFPKQLDWQIHQARRVLEGTSYRIVTILDAGWILELTAPPTIGSEPQWPHERTSRTARSRGSASGRVCSLTA